MDIEQRAMHLSFSLLIVCFLIAFTEPSLAFAPKFRSAASIKRISDLRKMSQDEASAPCNGYISSEDLSFADESTLQASRRAAFERLQTTVRSLAEFEGPENISLIRSERHDSADDGKATAAVVPVNSLIFQVTSRKDPLLVILASSDRVDIKKLEFYLEQGEDDERISASLTPPDLVEQECGFPPQSVPPLGHTTRSIRTIVDSHLLNRESDTPIFLLGGGGHPLIGCRIAVDTLLKLEGTEVADISSTSSSSTVAEENGPPRLQETSSNDDFPKPFFPIAPPDTETAAYVVKHPNEPNPLKPQPITIVGRINGVRRISQRLAFCDLAPPNYAGSKSNTKLDQYDLPWKSGTDGYDMAVQLIAGKTFCKNRGDIDGPAMLKQFKVGQLVLVQGKTNVGNRESIGHWVEKRSLHIVVWDYQLLNEDSMMMASSPAVYTQPVTVKMQSDTTISNLPPLSNAELRRRKLSASVAPPPRAANGQMDYLRLSDIFEQPTIKVVDNLYSVTSFAQDLTSVATEQTNGDCTSPLMVGVDAEWKPSFMMDSPANPQPVLLLQISIQELQTVYLLDLQALLRPVLDPLDGMNELEIATSTALSQLFTSTTFIKTGFQLMADLKRLAGSYPHMEAFRIYHGIVEVSTVAKKATQLAKVRNARQLITSLSRLTKYVLEKPLDKEQQISDWSKRPLSPQQQEYASLDAAVLPMLFEKSLEIAGASWLPAIADDDGLSLRLGRWKDDPSFMRAISSIRFLFLENDDPAAVRKLKAKKVVSDRYIVAQSWAEGMEEPMMPSMPSHGGDGPYTDVSGNLRVPSILVTLNYNKDDPGGDEPLSELIGSRVGKSKDSCLEPLLRDNPDFPEEAKLEYHHRSGYVEFADSVALYVNMPLKPGGQSPRGYPNIWIDEGKSMTWFLRDNEWNDGTTRIAKKLLGTEDGNTNGAHSPISPTGAILFVRMGRKEFLFCGRCRVTEPEDTSAMTEKKDWGLVELHLELQDWDELQSCTDFTSMTTARTERDNEDDVSTVASQHDCSPSRLAALVLEGDVVGAMGLALSNQPPSEQERSIDVGLATLKRIVSQGGDEESSDAKNAMDVLTLLSQKFVS